MSDIYFNTLRSGRKWSVMAILFALILAQGCERGPEPAAYPRIMTLPVTDVGSEGATFNVDLLDIGSQKITEFGFAWAESHEPEINNDDKILIEIPGGTGKFSAKVSSALSEGKNYYVRSFIKTDEYLVYGNELDFVSMGSLAPVITGFFPDSAGWQDTITIRGLNYSFNMYNNQVYIGNVNCRIVSASGTLLRAVVSATVTALENDIRVDVSGNSSNILPKKLKLLRPTLHDYQPRKVRWGDTLLIKGRNLKYVSIMSNNVQLSELVCPVISIYSDSSIAVKIPNTVASISNQLKLSINGFVLNGSEPIELLPPYFDFSPREASLGATLTLTGRFNSNLAVNQVLFGTIPAIISSVTYNKMVVVVPGLFIGPFSSISLKTPPFEITSTDEFKLTGPWKFIPTSNGFFSNYSADFNRSNGITFTLNGKGYMIDYAKGKMTSYDPSTNVLTTLKTHSQFSGKKGLTAIIHNDTAFILSAGDAFSSSKFSFYDVNEDQWKIYGPNPSSYGFGGGFSIGGKIYYGLVRNPGSYYFSNFFAAYNKGTSGGWVSKTSFPSVEGTYVAASFAYNDIGYILFANKKLYSYNPVTNIWNQLSAWPATGTIRYGPTVFILDNKIYIGLGCSGALQAYDDIWTYDPQTDQWTEVTKMPHSGRSSVLTFVSGGKAYLGYGIAPSGSLTDFYEFDPSSLK